MEIPISAYYIHVDYNRPGLFERDCVSPFGMIRQAFVTVFASLTNGFRFGFRFVSEGT